MHPSLDAACLNMRVKPASRGLFHVCCKIAFPSPFAERDTGYRTAVILRNAAVRAILHHNVHNCIDQTCAFVHNSPITRR